MSLLSYEDARPWAKAVRDEVIARRMPPLDAVKGVGDFRDDQSLTQPEMDVIVGWVEGGAPEGNPIYLPTPPPAAPPAKRAHGGMPLRHSLTLKSATVLTGVQPEGPVEIVASLRGGRVERLLWVRDFHPKWKRPYYFREPVHLPARTELLVYCSECTGTVKATVFTTP
jgi:hypothetical protein